MEATAPRSTPLVSPEKTGILFSVPTVITASRAETTRLSVGTKMASALPTRLCAAAPTSADLVAGASIVSRPRAAVAFFMASSCTTEFASPGLKMKPIFLALGAMAWISLT